MRLAADAAAHVQNVVSDIDYLEQASSELQTSLAALSQFLAQTGLEQLSPVDGSRLAAAAESVKQITDQLGQLAREFKKTGHYV